MIDDRAPELRQLLDLLSDSLGALASMIELSPSAVALYDTSGRCMRANAAYRELFGFDPEPDVELAEDEVLGRSGVLFWLRRAFSGETVTTPTFWYEHERLPRVDARRRIALSARAFPLRDRAGTTELIAITFRDETDSLLLAERRRLDEEAPARLRDEIDRADLERLTSEQQFRAIFEQCADGVMLTDDAGRVLDINPAGCRILGRRVQDVVGSRYWEHLDDTEHSIEDGVVHAKAFLWRDDGGRRDLEMRSVADFLPHRHLTTFSDVTGRNESSRRLEQCLLHLTRSQRLTATGSWELELCAGGARAELAVAHCSDECCRILGLDPVGGDLAPESVLQRIHPQDRDAFLSCLRAAASGNDAVTTEHRLVLDDGTMRLVRVRAIASAADDEDAFGDVLIRWIGTTQAIGESVDEEWDGKRFATRMPPRPDDLRVALDAFVRSVAHERGQRGARKRDDQPGHDGNSRRQKTNRSSMMRGFCSPAVRRGSGRRTAPACIAESPRYGAGTVVGGVATVVGGAGIVVVGAGSSQNRPGRRASMAASSAATHASPLRASYGAHSGLSALGLSDDSHLLSIRNATLPSALSRHSCVFASVGGCVQLPGAALPPASAFSHFAKHLSLAAQNFARNLRTVRWHLNSLKVRPSVLAESSQKTWLASDSTCDSASATRASASAAQSPPV
jgi:PAS domain-containing protein